MKRAMNLFKTKTMYRLSLSIFLLISVAFICYKTAEVYYINKYEKSIIQSYKYNNLATIKSEHGYIKESLKLMETAIKLNPDEATFYYNLVQLYSVYWDVVIERDNITKEELFSRIILLSSIAVTKDPTNFIYRQDLALNYSRSYIFNIDPDYDKLIILWNDALKNTNNIDEIFYVNFRLMEIYKKLNKKDEVLKILNFFDAFGKNIDEEYLIPFRIFVNSNLS